VSKETKQDKINYLLLRVLSGGLAGAATTVFVHPLDFARTRLGVDLGKDVSER
jgi:solute carrier family 25 (adenine nucleotide translocator) protein 4/5/6/31